ncbi:hypothetical protein [Magnetospirillum moscoviense]|uniref:Uncharacterized protein n=1 Tax=Magnetospirillum moscoviense TaxID=1437059 RepID=A0A178N0I7_9PROT|nr:hypothetical protein [Magnetospirillum moscoviense]OAN67985.1 hypothetical protein A6A05_18090 [Magnetospirillum moscoviense]
MWGWLSENMGWAAKSEMKRLAHLYFAPEATELPDYADTAIGRVAVPWFLRERKTILTNLASTIGHKYPHGIPREISKDLLPAIVIFIDCGGNYESLLLEAGIPTTSNNITLNTSANTITYPHLTEFWLWLSSYEIARFLYFQRKDSANFREIAQHLDTCRAFNRYWGYGSMYADRMLKYAISTGVVMESGNKRIGSSDVPIYELIYPLGLRLAHSKWCRILIEAHKFAPFMSIYHDNPLLGLPHRFALWLGTVMRWGYLLGKATVGLLVVQIALGVVVGLFFAAVAGFAANVGASHYWSEICPALENYGLPLDCQNHAGNRRAP